MAMECKDIKVRARDGGEFDCYLAIPDGAGTVPAIVLASAVHGVDKDMRAIADEFAARGYIAAAPDLFWRSIPGPLGRDDDRTKTLSLIHISEPTRLLSISYAVFCL